MLKKEKKEKKRWIWANFTAVLLPQTFLRKKMLHHCEIRVLGFHHIQENHVPGAFIEWLYSGIALVK